MTDLTTTRTEDGSVGAFSQNWRDRVETQRYHFKRGEPDHQVQFAFQNHWRVFCEILGNTTGGRALEVGCGRGSMGAFFAEAGFETHLLDISLPALQSAQLNFCADDLRGSPVCGDVLKLPYKDESFDAIVSIGLLEHFANIEEPIKEQLRVLRPGGVLLCYIVPERPLSVQLLAAPVNFILRVLHRFKKREVIESPPKQRLYRNDYSSSNYLPLLRSAGLREMGSFGMFPVPMVSHSWVFPFTPMSRPAEKRLIRLWRIFMGLRGTRRNAWICSENWGLAFLVWGRK